MKDLKILFSIVLLLIFFSCSEKKSPTNQSGKEEIKFIRISQIGGQLGYYRNVKITPDSIHIETGQTINKKHKEWHSAITPKTWKSINSCFKIHTLDFIKSSNSIQAIDGIDESFQIKTNKKSHVYVNAHEDKEYVQFSCFKEKILSIIPLKYQ